MAAEIIDIPVGGSPVHVGVQRSGGARLAGVVSWGANPASGVIELTPDDPEKTPFAAGATISLADGATIGATATVVAQTQTAEGFTHHAYFTVRVVPKGVALLDAYVDDDPNRDAAAAAVLRNEAHTDGRRVQTSLP